jgi:hypothetical protein
VKLRRKRALERLAVAGRPFIRGGRHRSNESRCPHPVEGAMASLGSAALGGASLLQPRRALSWTRGRPASSRAASLRVSAAAEAPPATPKGPKQPKRAKAGKEANGKHATGGVDSRASGAPETRRAGSVARPAVAPDAPRADGESGETPALPALPALDDVNPIELGRRSRAFVDDVWQRVLSLGGTRASGAAAALEGYELEREYVAASGDGGGVDFSVPQAAFHTVLVVGATGRVGTVLVRKLSLRGYAVKALVRSQDAAARCAPLAA